MERPSAVITKASAGNQEQDVRARSATVKKYKPTHTKHTLFHNRVMIYREGKGLSDQRNTFFSHHNVEGPSVTDPQERVLGKWFHFLLFKSYDKYDVVLITSL